MHPLGGLQYEGGRDIDSLEGVLVKSRSGWCGVVARRYFDSTRVAAAIVLATCFVATPARGQTPAPAEAPRVISPAVSITNLGWDDIIASEALVIVEWPDHAGKRLPADHLPIDLEYAPGDDAHRVLLAG